MSKRVVAAAQLFANKPTPLKVPEGSPAKFEGYVVKPRIPRRMVHDRKTGEAIRLAKPRYSLIINNKNNNTNTINTYT